MNKTLFSFLMIFSFLCFKAQKNMNIINNIEKEIKSKTIIKKESRKETGWNGCYETLIIYLKGKKPIMIEKIENQVMHLYLIDGGEKDKVTLISAKFYITNWEKNEYLRVGNIHYIGDKFNPNPKEERITIMPEDYIFKYDKNEVESLIKLEN